jgi:hypothetical protein
MRAVGAHKEMTGDTEAANSKHHRRKSPILELDLMSRERLNTAYFPDAA